MFGWLIQNDQPIFPQKRVQYEALFEPVLSQPKPSLLQWFTGWDNPVVVRRISQDAIVNPYVQTVAPPATQLSWLLNWENPYLPKRTWQDSYAAPVGSLPKPSLLQWFTGWDNPTFRRSTQQEAFFAPVFVPSVAPTNVLSWFVEWGLPVTPRRFTTLESFYAPVFSPLIPSLLWMLEWSQPIYRKQYPTVNASPEFLLNPPLVVTVVTAGDPQVHLERLNKTDRTHRL